MADKLTPQQYQAVHDRGGKLLVSAAAGSGKTKVLVDRLLTYLTDPTTPCNLDEFLIITYTKAAASELRGKIAAKLTERIAQEPGNRHLQKQMQRLFLTKISTVHGFCGDLLREYAYRLDLSADFRVADENECREIRETVLTDLLDRAYREQLEDGDFRAFVDSQGLGRDDRLVPQIIEQVYDSARCHLDPEGWLEECLGYAAVEELTDAAQTRWGAFLMEDLKKFLALQMEALSGCIRQAELYPEFAKVVDNLNITLVSLRLLQEADSWDGVWENRDVLFNRLTFPKKNPDLELTARIKAIRDGLKAQLKKKLSAFADPSAQVLEDLNRSAAAARGLVALVRQFDKDYSSAKRSRRCLDFGDLEHKTLDLLLGKSRSQPTAAAGEIGRRFREILVDEYQDSNGVQDAIFTALTREKQNCFMVGDVKQSIYQFRLADPGIFLEKYHSYAHAGNVPDKEGRKVLLSHNFRSGGEVIEAVNCVFSRCMRPDVGGLYYGEEESLREGIPHEPLPGKAVELYAIDVQQETYPEEADFVAEKIREMLQSGTLIRKGEGFAPVTPGDIVILLRSPGSAAGYFRNALAKRGIRCTTGSGTNLLKTQEIEVFRSFLQTILNPRLDIPLISTLASPVFGFTADDLAAFRAGKKKISVYDALLECDTEKARHFLSVLDTLRQEASRNTLTGLLEKCFTLTRMDSIFAAMPGGEARSANLQAFFQLAADFEKGSLRDLAQFLNHLDALEEKGLVGTGETASDCVTIMSIHKSKGLEFPVVFLSNLSRRFNMESLRAQILCDRDLGLGLSAADAVTRLRYPTVAKKAIAVKKAAEMLSEELRVLYVAMTRARDRLIMTYAAQKLGEELTDIALRMDVADGGLVCGSVYSMGEWVLYAALGRTEAGALHAIGDRPGNTTLSSSPWGIYVVEAPVEEGTPEEMGSALSKMPENAATEIRKALAYRYPHPEATIAPSKQTATGRKGREKDEEAAQLTKAPAVLQRSWRRPSFKDSQPRGKEYGSAIHAAMEYIRYENCGSVQQVQQEIARLAEAGFLSQEQAEMVNCEKIAAFFATEPGRKLREGTACLREFKFSILDDGSHYGSGLEGEQVLLQGVVDCALVEQDGITILDFKTDFVTEETLPAVVERYRLQVQTYADALSRIYEMPVKESLLYFFRLDRFVPL